MWARFKLAGLPEEELPYIGDVPDLLERVRHRCGETGASLEYYEWSHVYGGLVDEV